MEAPHTAFDLESSLQCALHFNQNTLIANKAGHMTDQQRETIQRSANQQKLNLILLSAIVFIVTGGILLLEFRAYGRLHVSPPILVFMLAIIAGDALIALFLRSRRNDFLDDLQEGIVKTASGPVRLRIIPRNTAHADYKVRISNLTFSVSKRVLLAFKDGIHYRVYYAPSSMTLLSAEPISATSSDR